MAGEITNYVMIDSENFGHTSELSRTNPLFKEWLEKRLQKLGYYGRLQIRLYTKGFPAGSDGYRTHNLSESTIETLESQNGVYMRYAGCFIENAADYLLESDALDLISRMRTGEIAPANFFILSSDHYFGRIVGYAKSLDLNTILIHRIAIRPDLKIAAGSREMEDTVFMGSELPDLTYVPTYTERFVWRRERVLNLPPGNQQPYIAGEHPPSPPDRPEFPLILLPNKLLVQGQIDEARRIREEKARWIREEQARGTNVIRHPTSQNLGDRNLNMIQPPESSQSSQLRGGKRQRSSSPERRPSCQDPRSRKQQWSAREDYVSSSRGLYPPRNAGSSLGMSSDLRGSYRGSYRADYDDCYGPSRIDGNTERYGGSRYTSSYRAGYGYGYGYGPSRIHDDEIPNPHPLPRTVIHNRPFRVVDHRTIDTFLQSLGLEAHVNAFERAGVPE